MNKRIKVSSECNTDCYFYDNNGRDGCGYPDCIPGWAIRGHIDYYNTYSIPGPNCPGPGIYELVKVEEVKDEDSPVDSLNSPVDPSC